jgi:tRNA 2-selenouridine synthase
MSFLVKAAEFLERSETLPVVDVRSPAEYGEGHIPGAFNIPLFDNRERAVIGTLYKHSGRDAAILKGIALAGPKSRSYVETLRSISTGTDVLVHCWRGGMRSEKMAELFEHHGFRAMVLVGGYKAYRRYIREQLAAPGTFVIIGGYTGSGKTEILRAVRQSGEQTVDLEELAHHKGSAFGGLGQPSQPTNEQFENNLFAEVGRFDLTRPLWMEDESRMIGHVTLPDPVIARIHTGLLIRIRCGRERRIRRLVQEYAACDPEMLSSSVRKISEKLGGTRTHAALDAIRSGDFFTAASLVLEYYDKAYDHSIERRPGQFRADFELSGDDPQANARDIIELSKDILRNGSNLSGL